MSRDIIAVGIYTRTRMYGFSFALVRRISALVDRTEIVWIASEENNAAIWNSDKKKKNIPAHKNIIVLCRWKKTKTKTD